MKSRIEHAKSAYIHQSNGKDDPEGAYKFAELVYFKPRHASRNRI
jgi:hypothetical protein